MGLEYSFQNSGKYEGLIKTCSFVSALCTARESNGCLTLGSFLISNDFDFRPFVSTTPPLSTLGVTKSFDSTVFWLGYQLCILSSGQFFGRKRKPKKSNDQISLATRKSQCHMYRSKGLFMELKCHIMHPHMARVSITVPGS